MDRAFALGDLGAEALNPVFKIANGGVLELRFERCRLFYRRGERIIVQHGLTSAMIVPQLRRKLKRTCRAERENMQRILHSPDAPLRLVTAEKPSPGPGEILIRVAAAGLNRPDLMQRAGLYPPPPGAPDTMGLEVSGEIEALGPGVTRWHLYDKVTALLSGGGYATYAIAHEGAALPAPSRLSMSEAAALPETVFTVWANVFESAALLPGETLLVHGGASGIGTTAIQMAKAHGARLFATAGDDAKVALCKKLGADRAINYRTEDFEEIVRVEGGADVVLDMVGGPYIQKNINIMNERGRIVMIAFLKGPQADLNLMRMMLKRITLTGSTLRSRSNEEKARIARAVEKHVWPWIEAGKVKPVIDSTFPLSDAEAAHARLQGGAHAGKIVLVA
ncbi:quinone oxidoreductase [alpha proteobacterium U9-1i]|nr:quinone oxidoreductase [alpha proteobacterium U9-1i]